MTKASTGTASAANQSIVSTEAAERIREWHEAAYRTARNHSGSGQTFHYLGKTLVIPSDVHQITGVSHLLGEALLAEAREGERILDMGTGSGINAILAASRGAHVVAVDISPRACDAAQQNVERSGFADRIEVHVSDLFADVEGQFDLIVYGPQVRWFAPQDQFAVPAAEENQRTVTWFVRSARRYLTSVGRVLVFVGPPRDLAYLMQLADEERFTTELVAQEALIRDGRSEDHFAFRLTPGVPRP